MEANRKRIREAEEARFDDAAQHGGAAPVHEVNDEIMEEQVEPRRASEAPPLEAVQQGHGAAGGEGGGAGEDAEEAQAHLDLDIVDPLGPDVILPCMGERRGPEARTAPAAQTLSPAAAKLAPLLLRLPKRELDELLKIITNPTFTPSSLPWTSADALFAALDQEKDLLEVIVTDQLEGGEELSFSCFVRKGISKLLQKHLLLPEAQGMAYEARPLMEDGIRKFVDLASGDWMRDTQELVRAYFGNGYVLPLIIYSDGAVLMRGGQKFHQLVLFVGSFTLQTIRSRHGFVRLALLPVVDGPSLGLSSERATILSRRVMCKGLLRALQEVKEMSYRGEWFECTDGQSRLMLPIPAAYNADLMEAASVFHVRPFPSHRQDANFLVRKDEMGLIDPPMQRRTEQGTIEVLK